MKQFVFWKLLNELRSVPNFKKKLKVFSIVGAIGIVMASTIAIWVGISVVRMASNQISSVNMQGSLETLGGRLQALSAITPLSCWDKAQSLLNLEPWTTRPAVDNLRNLKAACLEPKPPLCEGDACQKFEMRMNTADSEKTI